MPRGYRGLGNDPLSNVHVQRPTDCRGEQRSPRRWDRARPRRGSDSPFRAGTTLGWRTANAMTTDSATSRRATTPSTWADTSSSHWASSTRQTRGRSSATSAIKLSTARPTRKVSGAGPCADRWPVRGRDVAGLVCGQVRWTSSVHRAGAPPRTPGRPRLCPSKSGDGASLSALGELVQQGVFPIPGSPRNIRARLSPARAASSNRSNVPHSRSRPSNIDRSVDPFPYGMPRSFQLRARNYTKCGIRRASRIRFSGRCHLDERPAMSLTIPDQPTVSPSPTVLPDIRAFLDRLAEGDGPPIYTLLPDAARQCSAMAGRRGGRTGDHDRGPHGARWTHR